SGRNARPVRRRGPAIAAAARLCGPAARPGFERSTRASFARDRDRASDRWRHSLRDKSSARPDRKRTLAAGGAACFLTRSWGCGWPKRDHRASGCRMSMIFSENRCALFRIMLQDILGPVQEMRKVAPDHGRLRALVLNAAPVEAGEVGRKWACGS